ncbi:hypothetical protein BDY24DRAFT_436516 [Mrakia frigida]|uniref:nuclear FMR1 interacting 1 family protein n=1 Tax=Mrakia frigida TaxID=29902 RepID=UPI003FCC2569
MNLPPKPPPSSNGPPPPQSFSNSSSPYASSSTGVMNPNFRPAPPPSRQLPFHGLPQNPLIAQQPQFPQPPPSYGGGGNFSYGGLSGGGGGGQANLGAMAAAAALGVLGGGGAQSRYYQQPPPPQQQQQQFSYGYSPTSQQQPSQGYPYQQQQQQPPLPSSLPQLNAQGYTISSAFYNAQPPPLPTPSYAYPPPYLPSSSSNHYSSNASASSSSQPPAPRPPQPNRRLDTSKISCLPMRNCSLSGCSYTGLYKDVEIHEMDRHLIFPAGWKEKKGKRDGFGGATIEGTSISLQTPEQIAAWVAERKKRWPTKERVEEKAKAREDAIARGEFDPSSSSRRGARGGGRGGARGSTRGGRGGSRGGAESSYSSRGGEPPSKKGRWGAGAEEDQGWKSKGGKPAPTRAPVPGGNPIEDFDSDPLSSSSGDDDSSDSDEDDSGSDIDPVKDAVSSRLPPPARVDVDGEGGDLEVEEEVEIGGGREGGERGGGGGRTCTYFLTPQGCKMGDRCRFVHDESLRPIAPLTFSPSFSFSFSIPIRFSHRLASRRLELLHLPPPFRPPTLAQISSSDSSKRISSTRLRILAR